MVVLQTALGCRPRSRLYCLLPYLSSVQVAIGSLAARRDALLQRAVRLRQRLQAEPAAVDAAERAQLERILTVLGRWDGRSDWGVWFPYVNGFGLLICWGVLYLV